eukprot:scaffold2738_cov90-Isochrysis_galbana.AAC.2
MSTCTSDRPAPSRAPTAVSASPRSICEADRSAAAYASPSSNNSAHPRKARISGTKAHTAIDPSRSVRRRASTSRARARSDRASA